MTDVYRDLPPIAAIRQARVGFAITPSNSADLTDVAKGINISVSGTLQVTLADMADGTYVPVYLAAGVVHGGIEIKRVWVTGTDAGVIAGTITGFN